MFNHDLLIRLLMFNHDLLINQTVNVQSQFTITVTQKQPGNGCSASMVTRLSSGSMRSSATDRCHDAARQHPLLQARELRHPRVYRFRTPYPVSLLGVAGVLGARLYHESRRMEEC